jgi:cell wall-associated NlpC family hydrolase
MSQADDFVAAALGELGKSYASHRDCSGFTAWAARQAGFLLPEGSVAQYKVGQPVNRANWADGDLIFWDTFGPAPGHVAIYVGDDKVVHALNPERGIIVSDVDAPMGGPMMGARRVADQGGAAPNPKGDPDMSFTADDRRLLNEIAAAVGVKPPPPAPTTPVVGWTGHDLAGSAKKLYLPSSIEFRVILTPVGPNRSGQRLNWTGSTQHETGNTGVGKDAMMHSKWQDDGTPGHPDGYIGVHFYVDDKMIVQKIPVNEQGVHSGDWRNGQHTAVELCVNSDRNASRAERLAAYCQAGLLRMNGWNTAQQLYPHHTKPGPGCPVYLGLRWPSYERQVQDGIGEYR